MSLREEKNATRRKDTVACWGGKGLALPCGRGIRKVFREEGDVRDANLRERGICQPEKSSPLLLGTQQS